MEVTTINAIKTPAAVMLAMLNFMQGKEFKVHVNGTKLTNMSGINGVVKIESGSALKVSNSKGTFYYMEPFWVEIFPDKENGLSFCCTGNMSANA